MGFTREKIREHVTKLLQAHAQSGVPVAESSRLVADLGIDSLGVMELVAEIEDTFKLTIHDDVLKEIENAGDSGIYLRGSARHQVNIWSQPMGSGDINEIHKDKSVPADIRRALMPKKKADAKPGQWNRFVITLKGDRCTVVLNGETVIDNALMPDIPAEGPIALQYHHDAIQFANVFIKEL